MTVSNILVHATSPAIGGMWLRPHDRLARALFRGCLMAAVAAMLASPALAGQQLVPDNPQTPPRIEPGVARWDDRPRFQFGDALRIDLRARVQTDLRLRNDLEDPEAQLTFRDRLSVPRRRIGIEGVLFERIEFQIERELRDDDNPWRDLYADVRLHRSVRVRAGQFKVPFSLEQLTSAYDLDFASRASVVADLAPGRDVGVMVHGRFADRALKYEVGSFRFGNGIGLPPLTATDLPTVPVGRTLAARLTVAPLREGKSRGSNDLEFGVAVLQNHLPEGRYGLRGQFVLGDTFFERMFVSGSRSRVGFSGQWDAGRTVLRGEFIRASETRTGQAIDNGDLSNLIAQGWYGAAVFNVIRNRGNRDGWWLGDVDLAVRLDRLRFGSANQSDEPFLNPRADAVAPIGKHALTLGANLMVNRWMKVQVNTVREQLVDSLMLLSPSPTPVWSTVVRAQVAM